MPNNFMAFNYRDRFLNKVEVVARASDLSYVLRFARGNQTFMVRINTDLVLANCVDDKAFREIVLNLAKWMILNGTYTHYHDVRDLAEVRLCSNHIPDDKAFKYQSDRDYNPLYLTKPDTRLIPTDEHRIARETIFHILYNSDGLFANDIASLAHMPEAVVKQELVGLKDSEFLSKENVPVNPGISQRLFALSLAGREYYESKLIRKRQQAFIIAACFAPRSSPEKLEKHDKTLKMYKSVVEEMGIEPIFQEHEEPRKNIFVDIFDYIDTCEFVIADLTFERPNCYIEVGYALARAKTVMIFIENEYFEVNMDKKLPFDISPVKMQNYEYSEPKELEKMLRERIEKVRSR